MIPVLWKMRLRIRWWLLQEFWKPSPSCRACGTRWHEGCTH